MVIFSIDLSGLFRDDKLELVLFTKKPCPLCDELKADLENTYPGVFRLRVVDIEAKGNEDIRKKYRYDIPVLHYQNEFLCQHRLDKAKLNQILEVLSH